MASASQKVQFKIGENEITVAIPNLMAIVEPGSTPAVNDERAEIRRALNNPIGTPTLRELARGKKSAAIVVNDITRPYPGGLMVEEIARDLAQAGMKDNQIFLVVAYGNHRVNTDEECRRMFGDAVVDRFAIVHHVATDPGSLVTIGTTAKGMVVEINKAYAEADLKICTGCITPHQLAGFSGGRKSVIPGISGFESLKAHHSFPVRPPVSSPGWLEGNMFHEEAVAGARMAGVDFILNSVENESRGLVTAVAGELEEAHMAGVAVCREIWSINLPAKADVVIASPGGYPRDFDMHQAQKAVGCAEMVCRPGGQIILLAEARDGIAKFGKRMQEAANPQEIIDKYLADGYSQDSISKAYMWCRAIIDFNVSVACCKVGKEDLERMFLPSFATAEEAIADALERYGPDATFMAIPMASEIIPVIKS